MFLNHYIPNPVAFTAFGVDIMWYGILVGTGMLLGGALMVKRAPKHGIKRERVADVLLISIPAGVVGARLYYVAFNWGAYSEDFWRIANLRLGGLAIHGGLILGILAAFALCMRYKIKPLRFYDLAAPSLALGQAIGRWGNYFNSEAHGGPTDLPWAIPVGGEMVHPTFLYESLWCLLLFVLLSFLLGRRFFEGQITLLYGILYSLERFFVEILRTDSLMLGTLKQAQVVSVSVFAICLLFYVILYSYHRSVKKKGADFSYLARNKM